MKKAYCKIYGLNRKSPKTAIHLADVLAGKVPQYKGAVDTRFIREGHKNLNLNVVV